MRLVNEPRRSWITSLSITKVLVGDKDKRWLFELNIHGKISFDSCSRWPFSVKGGTIRGALNDAKLKRMILKSLEKISEKWIWTERCKHTREKKRRQKPRKRSRNSTRTRAENRKTKQAMVIPFQSWAPPSSHVDGRNVQVSSEALQPSKLSWA